MMNTALTKNQPSFYLFAQIYKSNICHGNVFVSSTHAIALYCHDLSRLCCGKLLDKYHLLHILRSLCQSQGDIIF